MNEVERIHQDLLAIQELISASADVSAITAYGEHSAKTLLLAGASYFERKVLSTVQAYLDKSTQSSGLRHFVYHQAVDRKFFSLFDFSAKAKSISPFLGKFGQVFSTWAERDMSKKGVDKESQVAFVNFCRLRNSLAHGNYATFAINKTLAEVRNSFDEAAKVLVWIEGAFEAFEKEEPKPDDLTEGGSDGTQHSDSTS